ncbi:hypothetical protein [Dysgonomonas sp. 511]|uniref:tetratricopeptide repeat protein n=1 Tax=Dysgonomonas sp. 511 TaxID=2302930 RepID=UPI0013D52C8C|nr:hypothetical protein [Dysgonomonas sp. 511]NDV77496.1 hypothetical protein [Dysgonomonas sp. 511]
MNVIKIHLLATFCLLLLLFSCESKENNEEMLMKKAEKLMEQHPDSALNILEVDVQPARLKQDGYNRYIVLYAQARDKNNKSLLTLDILILGARDYFNDKGDAEYAALASFYSGVLMMQQNKHKDAMEMYVEAENLAIKTKNDALAGLAKYYEGELYYKQRMKDKAISQFKGALNYFRESGKHKNEIISLNKLGMVYVLKDNLDSAFYYFDKSIELTKIHNDSSELAHIIPNIAVSLNKKGDTDSAKKYIREYLPYSKDEDKVRYYSIMAYCFEKEKNKDSVNYYINKTLELLDKEDKYSIKCGIYQLQTRMEMNEGNYKAALAHHKDYTQELFEVLEKRNSQAIHEVQQKYNFEFLRNQKNELEIKKNMIYMTAMGLGLCLILLIILFYKLLAEKAKAKADAERIVIDMRQMTKDFSQKDDSFKKTLLQHFDIHTKMALIETYLREDEKMVGQGVLKRVKQIVYGEKSFDWNFVYDSMNHLYASFPDRLRKAYPKLDETEVKICCLEFAKLNNAEMAVILNYSLNTVQMKKSNIRKKLGVGGYGNIAEFLYEFAGVEPSDR